MELLRLAKPSVGDEELAEIRRVVDSAHLTQGPAVARFESLVAEFVGVKHALATSSATTALHLSLVALGVGPGDDVVVPAFTFPATANVVVQLGARPRFADIDPDTFAVTAETVAAAISPQTVAVMPVDPFGYPAPMPAIVELAQAHGLRVVEDAACAIGASIDGTPCGAFPDVGCFSFHPRKVITTGEGGMITTDDDQLADLMQMLRNHGGRRSGGRFAYEAAGFNYRLSDIQGAMGIAQMGKLPDLLERRRALADLLTKQLAELPGLRPPPSGEGIDATHQSYVVVLDDEIDRDGVIAELGDLGIESTVGTYGLHLEPFFAGTLSVTPEMFPEATRAARQSLSLPLWPEMAQEDTTRVADALESALRRVT